jgi:hypothetical protein
MKSLEEIAKAPRVCVRELNNHGLAGTYTFTNGTAASLMVTHDGGCDHVSVSPFNHRKIPTWDMMCELKDLCFNPEEEACQIHPPKSEYVNVMPNCLHLWAKADGSRIFDCWEGVREK